MPQSVRNGRVTFRWEEVMQTVPRMAGGKIFVIFGIISRYNISVTVHKIALLMLTDGY